MTIGYVGSAWVGELVAAMRVLGYDTDQLLQGLPGASPASIHANNKLEIGSARRLYHRIDRITDDPVLGVKLGGMIDDGALGFLVILLWHAPTLGHVLENVVRFQWSISENGGYITSTEGNGANRVRVFEYVPVSNAIDPNRHQIMAVLTSTISLIRRVTRHLREVAWVRIPPTLDRKKIGAALNCPTRAGSDHAAFAVAEQDLLTPISNRDDALYSLTMDYALEIARFHESRRDLVSEVKAVIRDNGFASVSLGCVETALGIHRRGIQRSLRDVGLSFRDLKEEVVRNEAVAILLNTNIAAGNVALELGYSEPSAFHRAFKIWFGMTPSEFRKAEIYVA